MENITYRISGNYAYRKDKDPEWYPGEARVEIYNPLPIVGQKYTVVFFCDYDNTEYGENYIIEITEENIAEITFHMNDTENDITSYILVTE